MAEASSAIALLKEMVNDKRLYGHYSKEGDGSKEIGNWIPPTGVDEATLADWLDRARAVVEANRG